MKHQLPGIFTFAVITSILAGLALYGLRKKKFPLRGGGYVFQTEEPLRFRFWIFIFSIGAAVSAATLISLGSESFGQEPIHAPETTRGK